MNYANIVVIIPAYEPQERLIIMVKELKIVGYRNIIVIDDGSSKACAPIFDEVARDCVVLRNHVNRGKGYSLKKGIQYCLDHVEEMQAVITVDADGQHRVSDIQAICHFHKIQSQAVVIGVRDFTLPHIPFLRRMGNQLTSYLFQKRYHYMITDTQTGLRLLPRKVLPDLLLIQGDCYEYEMAVLIWLVQQAIPICECSIDTVYFTEQGESHFRIFRDSFRIYHILLRKERIEK